MRILVWLSLIHTNVKSFHSGACFILYHAFIKLHGFNFSPGIQGPKGWSARTKEIFFIADLAIRGSLLFPTQFSKTFLTQIGLVLVYGFFPMIFHSRLGDKISNSIYGAQEMVPSFIYRYLFSHYDLRILWHFHIFFWHFFSVTIPYKVDSLTLVTLVQQFPFWYFFLSLCRLTCFILTRPRQFPYFFFFFFLTCSL